MSGLTGHKNKKCAASSDGLHRWTTWEKIINGRHVKMTFCKECGKQP